MKVVVDSSQIKRKGGRTGDFLAGYICLHQITIVT